MNRPLTISACTLAFTLVAAIPVQAQQTDAGAVRPTWHERVSVSAHVAAFRPAGGSEVFSLIDRALAPGARALGPTLVGGELRVRMMPRWSLLLGAESGRQTVASVSRVAPAADAGPVRQQTMLELTSLPYVGVEWQALRWAGAHDDAADRLRVLLGAGGGVSRYRLRQWGNFVDVERAVEFADDFTSSGRGAFAFASAGLEVPLHRWVALNGALRRQFGSAPMAEDFARFDSIDLGGTTLSVGVLIR